MVASLTRRGFLKRGAALLLAPAVAGCGESTAEPEPHGVRLTARPGIPTTTPTPGLTELGLGGSRDGLLYVPESYSPDSPAPLFVGLHGAGGRAQNWGGYYERAESRGFILLAPDSRSTTWDLIGAGFGPDVAFLDRALAHTFERCRIDPTRIALGGFSDGATYALSLGRSNGDLFTHLVAYSPGGVSTADPAVGTPKIFVSHGRVDSVIPVTVSRDQIVPFLRDAGYDVTYQEFGGGHEVPAAISEAALDWFQGAA